MKSCKHEHLETCGEMVKCGDCGKHWGEKETVYVPYPVYYQVPTYVPNPFTPVWPLPTITCEAGVSPMTVTDRGCAVTLTTGRATC